MPRPKKPGAPEPKRRSRTGCWPCKARKVKCGEERPICQNCERTGETCDYSIRLNWEGRKKKNPGYETILFQSPATSSVSRHERRPSDAKSASSTATSSLTGDRQSMGSASEQTIAKSQPSSIPATRSEATVARGVGAFVNRFPATYVNIEPDAPLASPVLTSPIFSSRLTGDQTSESRILSRPILATVPDTEPVQVALPPPSKRLRYSVDTAMDSSPPSQMSPPASLNEPISAALKLASGPGSAYADSPVTPSASSQYSDDDRRLPSRQAPLSSEIRRMSVNSLLSGPPGPSVQYITPRRSLQPESRLHLSEAQTYWGVDPGLRDLDVGKNDDMNAIAGLSPRQSRCRGEPPKAGDADEYSGGEFGFGLQNSGLDRGANGYYERPVPIYIPRDLEPLPSKLHDNPMNLLYFHHFMNHTAKVLVPHDDPQSNPFRNVLPQMAVKNDNLLSLLLAYSASHRARLLQQPEPATRIALWVQDIFPALRTALSDPNQSISNANIATAIMLASLEIVSPTAFGYQIPWQKHLGLARDLIAARPRGLRWTRSWTQEDQVCAFLWSWLAYLDVLGTLSGGRHESSTAWILEYQEDDYEDEFDEIDCIMGMTTRCVYILAKIAELAKECDAMRIGQEPGGQTIVAGWKPPPDIITRAWGLEDDAKHSMALPPQPCKHLHASGDVARWDRRQIAATNEAFHWAGLVHLHRRVLGKASGHEDVQAAVLKIHSCLDYIPIGGNAEASLLFPVFTAGCDTTDEERRRKILERITSMERSGLMQVHKAKALIEKVWETGQPWETLLSTEFIG